MLPSRSPLNMCHHRERTTETVALFRLWGIPRPFEAEDVSGYRVNPHDNTSLYRPGWKRIHRRIKENRFYSEEKDQNGSGFATTLLLRMIKHQTVFVIGQKENDRNEKWYCHYSSLRYQSKMFHNHVENHQNEKEGCRSPPRESLSPKGVGSGERDSTT
ncbi:hypothetical protein Tco_0976017 [Tanacetum coccineum]|uniref:Uncharacterized protein n=1 Tax=Tanacetum coccineum TaxID=301880 RepID=A0ABQ5EG13_9ASTR